MKSQHAMPEFELCSADLALVEMGVEQLIFVF